ncbi:hypothetical protein ACFL04_03770 [Patescibacteria group bacterium]
MKIAADTKKIAARLPDKKFLEAMQGKLENMITFQEMEDAYWFAQNLDATLTEYREFSGEHPDLYTAYKSMTVKARWIGLQFLTENETVYLFENHLREALTMEDFDIDDAWRGKILTINLLDIRDMFKKRIRNTMERNKQRLTSEDLVIDEERVEPTIGNWIRAYNVALGTEIVPLVKYTEYLFRDKNITKLSDKERALIETLVTFYEKLKLSSETPEGLEENIPVDDKERPGDIIGGVFQPLKKVNMEEVNNAMKAIQTVLDQEKGQPTAPEATPAGAMPALPPEPVALPPDITPPISEPTVTPPTVKEPAAKQPKVPPTPVPAKPVPKPIPKPELPKIPVVEISDDIVFENENKLLEQSAGDVNKLHSILFNAIKNNRGDQIVASLLILARLGGLPRILIENKDLANLHEKNVIPQLADSLQADQKKIAATYTPAHLREFLKFILTRSIAGEQQVAQYGMQIEEVMQSAGQHQYDRLVYFDNKSGQYRWAEAQVDKDGSLH